jgi:alkylation response protein AidB-like acyl-CoA dehydrogenase
VDAGQERRAAAFGELLRVVVEDGAILAAAVSEPGQNLTRPGTTAVRTEHGWIVDGRKLFCTMSPAATALYTAVRFADGDGRERYGYALVPADAPGVTINGDWDALGMRASGSHSVTFADVELPAAALRGGFRTGDSTAYMERNLIAGLMHASSSVGIAEAAHAEALAQLGAGRGSPGSAHTRMLVAASTNDLAAVRASLDRAAALVDEHGEPAADEVAALFAEVQSAKAFANEAATRIVDRALALSGGSGYLTASPLSRAYRDVRAGAFMHPLGANRAYDFIGGVALGLAPDLD